MSSKNNFKYAIIVMDGAADEPLEELGGKTIFEAAEIPHTDWISIHGHQGLTHNIPLGFKPGSDVALMSVMGYDPETYYTGRAPLEAAAQNIRTGAKDWIFRCNLVTISDGVMQDYSAGHIESVQAARLIEDLNRHLADDRIRFYAGVGYRHLMVVKNSHFDLTTTPPHDISDQAVSKYLPRGKNSREVIEIMEKACEVLAEHELNKVRGDLGENPANAIWLWGEGTSPRMDLFRERFGVSGAVISAVDLLKGLAKLVGLKVIEVEGATGYIDTNYAGKGQAAIEALADVDLVLVHVEAPDEAGHGGMAQAKKESVEQIDRHIVGPVLQWLKQQEGWRIMILPDHPTPIRLRTHTAEPVPFAIAGTGITIHHQLPFSEKNSLASGFRVQRGCDLMEFFLQK